MEAKGWNQFYNIIDNVVTGIDGVQAGDGGDVAISAGNGRIALAGTSATTPYHVYDASGREVATGTIGTATEVSCKPGMYIVRAGGAVKKVFVGR